MSPATRRSVQCKYLRHKRSQWQNVVVLLGRARLWIPKVWAAQKRRNPTGRAHIECKSSRRVQVLKPRGCPAVLGSAKYLGA